MGIRIIIASTSGEKAKYKERILDWIIAFCLLFFMHYIMAASVTVVEKINTMLGKATGVYDGIELPSEYGKVKFTERTTVEGSGGTPPPSDLLPTIGDVTSDSILGTLVKVKRDGQENYLSNAISLGWIKFADSQTNGDVSMTKYETVEDTSVGFPGGKSFTITLNTAQGYVTGGTVVGDTTIFDYSAMQNYLNSIKQTMDNVGVSQGSTSKATEEGLKVNDGGDGSKVLYFMNYARLFLNVKDDDQYIPISVGYLIIYIALTVFTVVFAFRYIKRVIYLAFLTMVAPMVAMTYPLDKLKDRKSTSMEYVV